jgi:hypothetical protein
MSSGATFATLVAPTGRPALSTADSVVGWRIVGVRFTIIPTSIDNYGIVVLGSGQAISAAQQPKQIILDRVLIDGDSLQTSRCVSLNGAALAVIHSQLRNCHARGRDAQAIGGWEGDGPLLIDDNYLEGSTEVIAFGGADTKVVGQVPSDITITGNDLTRPLSWAKDGWLIKNLFELKLGRRILVDRNRMWNNWINGQAGHAIIFQAVSQDCGAPWVTISDITLTNNVVSNSFSGVTLLAAMANRCTGFRQEPMARVLFQNNLFERIGTDPISGQSNGRQLQLLSDLRDHTFLQNTFTGSSTDGSNIMFDSQSAATQRTVLWNNVFDRTLYGVFSSDGPGRIALAKFAPDGVTRGNVFVGQSETTHPVNNFYPTVLPATPLMFDGARVGADSNVAVLPPVVVLPPISLPKDCSQAPVGYVSPTNGTAYTIGRTERTTVLLKGDCLGVVTLNGPSTYRIYTRKCGGDGWVMSAVKFTARSAAIDAAIRSKCPG